MKIPIQIKIIVTGNYNEYLKYCQENKENPNEPFIRYARSTNELKDFRGCKVIYYGNYWRNILFGKSILEQIKKT